MKYALIEWNNGTPYSPEFGDVYYSADSGIDETQYVFLQQNQLAQRWTESDQFVIGETGFGTGLNFIVTMKAWLQQSKADNACLHFISIEKHPVSPDDIVRLASQWPDLKPYFDELLQVYPPPLPGMHLLELANGKIKLHLVFDEVEHALEQINYKVDAWYLDGFAPSRNPQMWNEQVFELIGRNTRVGGSFSTYTASGVVRRGMANTGFVVHKAEGYGSKRDMLKGFIFEQRCYIVDKPWFSLPESSFVNNHVVIVGAGLAGLTTAWAMFKRGWKITMIDRDNAVAAGASGNPAGLLMPRLTQDETMDSRFYINAYVHAIQCLDHLQAISDEQFWYKTGNVLVDDTEKLKKILLTHQYPDNLIKYVDSDEAQTVTGINLKQDVLQLVDAGWVDVKRLCNVIQRLSGEQLEFVQADVSDIKLDHNQWIITDKNNETIKMADCVVIANGAMARQMPALTWLPLDSVRGQLTMVRESTTSRKIKSGISAERYITPAHDGQHVIGASYNLDDGSLELSSSDQDENISCMNQLMPGVLAQQDKYEGRVAFRAVSQDRVPQVGCVADIDAFEVDYHDLHHGRRAKHYPAGSYLPGLYLSTGHGSRGLTSCFISGEIIGSMICSEPLPVEKEIVDYLNPARFIIRKLKRNRS